MPNIMRTMTKHKHTLTHSDALDEFSNILACANDLLYEAAHQTRLSPDRKRKKPYLRVHREATQAIGHLITALTYMRLHDYEKVEQISRTYYGGGNDH